MTDKPLALIAELTHRCPLRCVYCSNPLEMAKRKQELSTTEWVSVFGQAAAMGMLHVHFTGGEPLLRDDLAELVAAARKAGLYVNLITSGVGLHEEKLSALVEAGLDHIQLSFQDSQEEEAVEISGVRVQAKKLEAARLVRQTNLAFTVNLVVHRKNLDRLEEMITFAEELGPQRIEIANVQYYGWAMKNRAALLPTREQVERSIEVLKRRKGSTQHSALSIQSGNDSAVTSGAKLSHQPSAVSKFKINSEVSTLNRKGCQDTQRTARVAMDPSTLPCSARNANSGEPLPNQSIDDDKPLGARNIAIDFITPDYYGKYPKPCMGGWGRRLMLIDPAGRAMPCHAAAVIPNIRFENVRDKQLRWIWEESSVFNMFRGTDWMQEPCKTCPKQEQDFGGCRCQALLLAGDASATDPVCTLSSKRPLVDSVLQITNAVKENPPPHLPCTLPLIYRSNPV
jgi:radical SAM protein with 4Fe4S-binding SPASM domain